MCSCWASCAKSPPRMPALSRALCIHVRGFRARMANRSRVSRVYPSQGDLGLVRLTLVLVLLLATAMPAQAAWPGFHNDSRHTGFQSGTQYTAFKEAWWSAKIDPVTQVEA